MLQKISIAFVFIICLAACKENEVPLKKSELQHTPVSLKEISTDAKMVYIPGGDYKPFFGSDSLLVKVEPFLMDERPVTNAEFLEFLKANPQWRKSQVKQIFADHDYLKEWKSDLELPENFKPNSPITNISWFAAKAYATSVGKRLPTLDEWEFVAMADENVPNARKLPSYSDHIVDQYLIKNKQLNEVKYSKPNYWKIYNMFDMVWEWTDDFNSVLTTGDSRNGSYDDKNLFCAGSATSSTDIMNYAAYMRFGLRTSLKADYAISNLGFRCAKDTILKK